MSTMFIGVTEAAEILGTSESYAYKLIQKMNKQMREEGIRDRLSVAEWIELISISSFTAPEITKGEMCNADLQGQEKWYMVCNGPV